MSIIRKYITSYLLSENTKVNKRIAELFINSITIKDSDGYLLEEAWIEDSELELEELIQSGKCEDEFFAKIYNSLLSNGFEYFARGTGRIVFTHPQAANLIFKLIIPGEETSDNIEETSKEKEMMKKHPHLFGELYSALNKVPILFETEDYFIIVEKLIPLFNSNFECLPSDNIINLLKKQFGFNGDLNSFKDFMRDKLIKYYEIAGNQETDYYNHIEVPATPPDMLDNFCEKVIKFSKEVKPDNVGLKAIDNNKYKFVMLDV